MSILIPTEAQEGSTLVAYLRVKKLKFTHVANETGGTPEARRRAIRVKQQGVSRGFPDYLIIVNGRLIAIELKRKKFSATSQQQVEWVAALNAANVETRICKGAEEAIKFIEEVKRRK